MATNAQPRRNGNNPTRPRGSNAGEHPPKWLKSAIAFTEAVVLSIDATIQDLLDSPRGRAWRFHQFGESRAFRASLMGQK